MRFLIVFVCLFIAYGSLFPFDFSLLELEQQYSKLLSIKISGWGDVLANIILFMPLGLLYAFTLRSNSNSQSSRNKLSVWSWVFVFALILQVLQIALPERDQNIFDVLFNMFGFSIAYLIVFYIDIPRKYYTPKLYYLPVAIALTYIFSELSPFVPTFDFQEIKSSVKPLLAFPTAEILSELLFSLTMWLLVIRLISFQQVKAPLRLLLSLWLVMLGAKVIIYSNYLNYVDIIAPAFAILLALVVNVNTDKVTRVLLYFSILVFTLYGFSNFSASSLSFSSFIPFYSYLNGNYFAAVQGFIFKLFFFSAILWLSLELSISIKKAAISLGLLALMIETLQLFIPTRTTDFADVILVFSAYLLVRHLGDYLASQEESNYLEVGRVSLTPRLQLSLYCIVSFCVFYLLVNVLLGIPGVPYNVVELFEHDASFIDLLFFFVFLHGLGGASYYIASKTQQYSQLEGLKIVGLHLVTLAVLFLFLWFAVSTESLEDIVGASKMKQAIYANQTSQSFFMMSVKVLSLSIIANCAQFLDFLLRFSALFGLVQVPLTFWLMCFNPAMRNYQLISKATISIILLTICFHTVFTFAITDNITELIAQPFLLLLSLIALTFFIALAVQLISKRRYLSVIILTCTFAILSWQLALFVFDVAIVKYGFTFSALDFLIGAGREHTLDSMTLMLRWTVFIIAFQGLMIFGCLFYKKWQPKSVSEKGVIKLTRFLLFLFMLFVIVYIGNRLFGASLHWQTVTHFFNKASLGFAEDSSKVDSTGMVKIGNIYLNDKRVQSLTLAMKQAKEYDTIRVMPGYYEQAGILTASNVRIIAEPGAVIFGETKEGKGALVIKGDNTYIEGLECHSIYVPDNNGVCIRLEGKGITLNSVYFHHAQGGLLGSRKGGDIRIESSRFEHLGDGAFYHGIYTLRETRLFINNSYFLNNRNGGHEIKSRSSYTEITNSVIASTQSRDSRLIDVPNGGVLIIKNNVLIEGRFSENHDLLSWGVEGITHPKERVVITDNMIVSDKNKARLISLKRAPNQVMISDNIVVGTISGIPIDSNLFFKDRASLSIPPAPFIPDLANDY